MLHLGGVLSHTSVRTHLRCNFRVASVLQAWAHVDPWPLVRARARLPARMRMPDLNGHHPNPSCIRSCVDLDAVIRQVSSLLSSCCSPHASSSVHAIGILRTNSCQCLLAFGSSSARDKSVAQARSLFGSLVLLVFPPHSEPRADLDLFLENVSALGCVVPYSGS